MKKTLALGLALLLALALCGCNAAAVAASSASADKGIARPEGGRYKLCASYPSLSDSYYSAVDAAIHSHVAGNDDRLVTLDAGSDALSQAEQIDDMLTQEGIDILFVAPMSEAALAPVLADLAAAGVPVISICLPVADADSVDHQVVSNFRQGGAACVENAGALLAEGSSFVVLEHTASAAASEAVAGWDTGFGALVGQTEAGRWDTRGDEERSYGILTGFLEEAGTVGAIFCSCDEAALGAVRALQDAGFDAGEVLVYSVGGSPAARKLVASGYLTGLASERPAVLGADAAALAYRVLAGRSADGTVRVTTTLITADNIGAHQTDAWS